MSLEIAKQQGPHNEAPPELFDCMFNTGLRRLVPEPGGNPDAMPDAVSNLYQKEFAFLDTIGCFIGDQQRRNLIAAAVRACPVTKNRPEYLCLIRSLWQDFVEGKVDWPTDAVKGILSRLGQDSMLSSDIRTWVEMYAHRSKEERRLSALGLAADAVALLGCGVAVMSEGPLSDPRLREIFGGPPSMVAFFLGWSLLLWREWRKPVKMAADLALELALLFATGLSEIVEDKTRTGVPDSASHPPTADEPHGIAIPP